ncbi:LysR family transcriptional regulator [Paraburkholderia sp. D15]|uniref:LysR family transcriptional regulator n=1 Tax=Paraburkholderia sp. D15 TaxID=2880218 RepID=UPI00247A390C|nr:LysR family transcriptional regulator [Paraburkholderia sp. D15]WGS51598.1 LysR family transcriptional regulator [Paraburkholderia sp. D15]
MNVRHLEYFVMLAQELHFRRSAERLGITQAPLSLAIQALEAELGARLFHRTRRSVVLTEAGHALLDDARAIIARIEHAKESVWETVSGEVGRLRVGFTNASSLSPFFPRLIHAYRTQRPKVNIALLELSSSRQIEAIEQRELDVGLLRLPDSTPPAELVFTPLMDEPLLVAMHAGHRLAQAATLKLKDLRNEPFIAYPRQAGVAISQQTLALCAKRGFEPQVVQEAQQASTLIGLTATGLGIALVPATLRSIVVPGVVFRALDEPDTTSTLYIAHRYGDANARAMQFAELAKSCALASPLEGAVPAAATAAATAAKTAQKREASARRAEPRAAKKPR